MPRPRNSIAFQPQEDKENSDYGNHTSRKRSKSLGGSDDITLPIPRKRRVAGGSRIPTVPRGILKSSYSTADENHTVIGVMQIALKDESIAQSKSTNSKTLSRRVSFAPEATLHTFELEREDTHSSSSTSATAASTPGSNRSDSTNLAACGRSPLANIRLYNEPSPVSPRYGNCSSPWQRSTGVVTTPPRGLLRSTNFDGYDDDENDDEVEMEDATDVFDDVFGASEISQQQSEPAKLQSYCAESTNSFFSPLVARLRPASSPNPSMRDNVGNDGFDTEPMNITTAIGSIQRSKEITQIDCGDEATMDVTCAVGAIEEPAEEQAMDITTAIGSIQCFPINHFQQDDDYTNVTMDVTKAVGSIHEIPSHQDEDDGDYTSVTMDVTKAIGEIESAQLEADDTEHASLAMDVTVAVGTINMASVDGEYGGNECPMDVTLMSPCADSAIMSSDCVPSVTQRAVSQTASSVPITNSLPDQAFPTSRQSPKLVSTPLANHGLRRTSSIGRVSGTESPTRSQHRQILQVKASEIPETPTRSPRSTEVLKRRRSLLECEAPAQVFDGRHLSICTPESQKLKSDINKTLFTVSTNGLQKRIQSLTPKKPIRSPIKIPVSSARKQAIEALKFEEQEALSKIYSPLKASSLASPSSSITKKSIKSLSDIPAPVMDLEPLAAAGDKTSLRSHAPVVRSEEEDSNLPISLNEFLRMTSIQFLEGLNTKRRNTTFLQPIKALSEPSLSATVRSRQLHCPMLELFEFSCRELRKNIEEGKELFDKLEISTTEKNPELFRQYVCSSLDGQAAFCAQFKVIKSYARLQSKGVWYKWRSKLLNGIMGSLNKNANSLKTDCANLKALQEKLRPSLADIKSRYLTLKCRLEVLRKRISDVEDCDKGQLATARHKLAEAELDVSRKMETRRQLLHENEALSSSLVAQLSDIRALKDDIAISEKTVEENKGVNTTVIISTKNELEWICKLFGWTLKSLNEDTLVLCHENDLEVEVAISKRVINRISTIRTDSSPVTEFFIKFLASASKNRPLAQALCSISDIWRQKAYLTREIGLVASHYITEIRLEDGTLTLKPEILLEKSSTKLQLQYMIWVEMAQPRPSIRCEMKANIVYGKVDEAELFTTMHCMLDAASELGILRRHCDRISFCV
ncbi:Spc7 kinetochore protein-domain-containing protein [Lipomyces kononenkoae]|uniref:Spc7 kinetochore protein-domain-containing protein n=1 Tax=Lipomyces kononenkoae TaxID=34357 RepID=A0ACC3T974_LIPKO